MKQPSPDDVDLSERLDVLARRINRAERARVRGDAALREDVEALRQKVSRLLQRKRPGRLS